MRHYMAELGIFLSRDFLPYPNKYRAWSNNPVGQVDRDGLESIDPNQTGIRAQDNAERYKQGSVFAPPQKEPLPNPPWWIKKDAESVKAFPELLLPPAAPVRRPPPPVAASVARQKEQGVRFNENEIDCPCTPIEILITPIGSPAGIGVHLGTPKLSGFKLFPASEVFDTQAGGPLGNIIGPSGNGVYFNFEVVIRVKGEPKNCYWGIDIWSPSGTLNPFWGDDSREERQYIVGNEIHILDSPNVLKKPRHFRVWARDWTQTREWRKYFTIGGERGIKITESIEDEFTGTSSWGSN